MIGFVLAALMACTPNSETWPSTCQGMLIIIPNSQSFDDAGILTRINEDWGQAGIALDADEGEVPAVPGSTLFIAGKAADACSGSFELIDDAGGVTKVDFQAKKGDSGLRLARSIASASGLVAVDYFEDDALLLPVDGTLRFVEGQNGCSLTVKPLAVDFADGAWLYELTAALGFWRMSNNPPSESFLVWFLPKKIKHCASKEGAVGIAGAVLDVSDVWRNSVAVYNNDLGYETGRWASHEIGHLLLNTACHEKGDSLNLMHGVPSGRTCQIGKAQATVARSIAKALGWPCVGVPASPSEVKELLGESSQMITDMRSWDGMSLSGMYERLASEAEVRYVAELLEFAWNPMTRQDRSCEPDVRARTDVRWAREKWRELASGPSTRALVHSYIERLTPTALQEHFIRLSLPPPPPHAPPPATPPPPAPPPQ